MLKNKFILAVVMRKLFIILVVLFLAACIIKPPEDLAKPTYEITEHDVLDLLDKKQITGDQVSYMGVKIGDSFTDMVRALDSPNVIDEYFDLNIVNAKYTDELGNATVLFHLQDDVVERITIRPGLNPDLINRSKIEDWSLDNITTSFGKPDYSYDTQFIRVYEYHDLGFEIFHKRKSMYYYAFVRPKVN